MTAQNRDHIRTTEEGTSYGCCRYRGAAALDLQAQERAQSEVAVSQFVPTQCSKVLEVLTTVKSS